LQRHAGSVLASTTARTREHFICEVREASTLRRGTQESLLSLLSVTSLTARPQALDDALGGEGSRSNAVLPAIDGRILQLFATMETNWGWLINKVNKFLVRHPPFSATQHLLYAQPRPSPASPYAKGSLFPLADPSKEPFQPYVSAPFFSF
jgi:hypothetical protein